MRINLKSLLILTCVMPFCRFALAQDSTVMPAAQTPAAGQEYLADPKFQKAIADAKERKPMTADEHMARWKHAAKVSQNKCVECLHEVLRLQMKELQWKDAVNTAKIMEDVTTEPREKVFAETNRGQALMQMNDGKPKPDQLKEADTDFQAALALAPKHKNALFHDGRAEAMLGNDEGAKALFERYLQGASYSDTYRTRVEHFVENPKLAALQMAPPFTFTTSEGEQISLDDMNGKVVLVDFWATWCGPCREALPTIKKIAKEFQGQPLVVVSISIDHDDIAWKNFIAKNEMTWAQYRDANGALSNAYGAQSIPRTFTIDTDGVLKSVKVGSDSDPEGDVKKLVKKAVEAEKKKAMATDNAATE